jgi:hypothetical protein
MEFRKWAQKKWVLPLVLALWSYNLALGKRPGTLSYLTSASFLPGPRTLLPGTEKDVLPVVARQALTLLEERNLAEYRLSEKITADPLFLQRIIEGSWPRKLRETSAWLVALKAEPLPAGCRAERSLDEVTLARCG